MNIVGCCNVGKNILDSVESPGQRLRGQAGVLPVWLVFGLALLSLPGVWVFTGIKKQAVVSGNNRSVLSDFEQYRIDHEVTPARLPPLRAHYGERGHADEYPESADHMARLPPFCLVEVVAGLVSVGYGIWSGVFDRRTSSLTVGVFMSGFLLLTHGIYKLLTSL